MSAKGSFFTFFLGAAAGIITYKYFHTQEGRKAIADLKERFAIVDSDDDILGESEVAEEVGESGDCCNEFGCNA